MTIQKVVRRSRDRHGNEGEHDDYVVVRRRRPGRLLAAVVVLITGAALGKSIATNPNMRWDVIGDYLFSGSILSGIVVTVYLTAMSMIFGIVSGTVLAIMHQSSNFVLKAIATGYIAFFRGTPLIVQIIFWGYLGAIYPQLAFDIPFTPISLYTVETNSVMTPLVAAALALSFNEAAYMAEVVRGGFMAVNPGQQEAASALGMTPALTMRRILIPQALRVIIPSTGNQLITMLKATAMVSVIAGEDLLTRAQQIYNQNFQVLPLLVVASIWYLVIVLILTAGQHQLERRYGRGATRIAQTSLRDRLFRGSRTKRGAR